MNSTLKRNLLKNLAAKRANGGFTLIELLVVVIIVGILAAVALPNLLGQIGKARETEGKNGVGTVNRAQQAFHFEQGNMIDVDAAGAALDLTATNPLGVVLETDFYTFTPVAAADGQSSTVTADNANAEAQGTRNYGAGIGFDTASGQYQQIVCQSVTPNDAAAVPTVAAGAAPACGANHTELN